MQTLLFSRSRTHAIRADTTLGRTEDENSAAGSRARRTESPTGTGRAFGRPSLPARVPTHRATTLPPSSLGRGPGARAASRRDATRRNDDAPQMVNIYLLITGGTVVASLESILNHPSEVLNLLGDALPSVAVYFAQVRPCAGSVLPGRSIGRLVVSLVVSLVARLVVCGGAWHLRRGSSVGRSVRGNVAPAGTTARSSPRGAAPGSRRAPQRLKRQKRGSPLAARGSRLVARVRSSSPSRRS